MFRWDRRRHLRTTSFLVDSDILIDAGTGVGDLTLAELSQIDYIFITHSHLDHVTSIPFLVDTVGGMRSKPLVVYATRATTEILRNHLFNWAIWPDFSEIPSAEAPFLRYEEIAARPDGTPGCSRDQAAAGAPHRAGGRLPPRQRHGEPGLHRRHRPNDALWREVNRIANLKFLIIETAFSNRSASSPRSRAISVGDARRGARQARARRRDLHHAHETRRDRADDARDEECAGKFRPQMLQNNLVLEF